MTGMQHLTDPAMFERFHKALTSERAGYTPWYFLLSKGLKDPVAGISWKQLEGRLTFEQALKKMRAGYNIGIAATAMDPLCIVDVDDITATPNEIVKPTLSTRSRKRIGRHYFYFTEDPRCKETLTTEGKGEIRSRNEYVVAPGSYVMCDQKTMDAMPESEKAYAGRYTIENERAPNTITFEEFPPVFLEQAKKNREAEKEAKKRREEKAKARKDKKPAQGSDKNKSAMWDLSIEDIMNIPNKTRFKSLFHESTTGKNTSLNDDGGLTCWRHLCTHTPLSALAVMAGVADCNSAGQGFNGGRSSCIDYTDGATLFKMWTFAKREGMIPANDPIPSSALRWYAVDQGICKPDDVVDGWKLPADAYNQTIALIEAKEKISSGRKKSAAVPDTTTSEAAVPELTWAEIAKLQQREFDLRLEANLPEDHFISMFTRWMQTISDGYTDYAVTCGLWTLSAIATEKTVLKLRQGHIRPNLWVVNLGRSTTSRKSTIINKTRQMFESATDISLPNEDFSIEGYLETLSLNPVMHNVRDEMSGLMAKYHKKYNDGIYDLECVIYDCEGIQKTLASGKNKQPKTFSVETPRVTKLYATTPDNFARYMSIDDFTCGYGVRFLFASPQYKHTRKPLVVETDADIQLWGNVLVRIKKLWKHFEDKKGDTVFTATQEAMDYFDEICQTIEEQADKTNNDMLGTVIGRSEAHILKIAMLLEIGKPEVSTTIGIEMMQAACDMVTGYFIPCIMNVVDRLEEDVKNNKIEKIISILRRLGGTAAHTKLLRDSHLTSKEFGDCITTMVESRAITMATNVESKAKVYRLLSHNNKFNIRKNHKVRNVRTYTDTDNNRANIANSTTSDIDTPLTLAHSGGVCMRTCEPCELCESSEQKVCGKCGCELSGQIFQGPAGLGMICEDCQAELDREHDLCERTDEQMIELIKSAIYRLGYVRGLKKFTAAEVLLELPKGSGVTTEILTEILDSHLDELKIIKIDDKTYKQQEE